MGTPVIAEKWRVATSLILVQYINLNLPMPETKERETEKQNSEDSFTKETYVDGYGNTRQLQQHEI